MKARLTILLTILISVSLITCKNSKEEEFKPKLVYESAILQVTQITENCFIHTSFLQTNDFGNVPCNGLIVSDSKEVIIFDTPVNDKSADELIKWIKETLHYNIKGIIPTHFHDDCLGGLQSFHTNKIPSYAYLKTIELAKENNFIAPQNSFNDSLLLKVGDKTILAKSFGEGHTKDNVVGYFPSEELLFGGCLIKELDATKGYLGDANVAVWSTTVENIKKRFPNLTLVVPGHGKYGNAELLDYTIDLFKTKHFGEDKFESK